MRVTVAEKLICDIDKTESEAVSPGDIPPGWVTGIEDMAMMTVTATNNTAKSIAIYNICASCASKSFREIINAARNAANNLEVFQPLRPPPVNQQGFMQGIQHVDPRAIPGGTG